MRGFSCNQIHNLGEGAIVICALSMSFFPQNMTTNSFMNGFSVSRPLGHIFLSGWFGCELTDARCQIKGQGFIIQ